MNYLEFEDDESCPCGSGEQYSLCCKNRKDKELGYELAYENMSRMEHDTRKLLLSSKFKTCFHPNKDECCGGSINAHSLQKNGVLSRLEHNGRVIIIDAKFSKFGDRLDFKLEGKSKATTFTGFCKKHDKELFSPIEDYEYKQTEEQNFLFAYRVYAYEHYKKLVAFEAFKKSLALKPTLMKNDFYVKLYRGYQAGNNDMESTGEILTKALLEKDFDVVSSLVIKLDYKIPFATCFGYSPLYDLKNGSLNFTHQYSGNNNRLPLNFVTIIPQNKESFIIYSWLRDDSTYFEKYINQIASLDKTGIKRVFNNLIPEYSENIVISPLYWDRLSEYQKELIEKTYLADFTSSNNNYIITNGMRNKKNISIGTKGYNLFREI